MRKVLFFAEAASLAHVARPVVLAQALDAKKWQVEFAASEGFALCFAGTDWPRHKLTSIAAREFLERLAGGKPLYTATELQSYVEDEVALLEKVKPDVVVGDFRLSLSVSARVAKIPYVAIANAHWSPYSSVPEFPMPDLKGMGWLPLGVAKSIFSMVAPFAFGQHRRPLNRVRELYGLEQLSELTRVYTDSDLCLYADTPDLVPTRNLPPDHQYVGPIVWCPAMDVPSWWGRWPDTPRAYVTLGSTGRADQLPRVLAALKRAGVVAIVATAGRADIASEAGKIYSAAYLPGDQACRAADFVVCNGGSATVYQALAQGVPVIGICSNMDQFLTMRCVQQSGAGITLRAGRLEDEGLDRAMRAVSTDSAYTAAAKKVQQDFQANPAEVLFPRALAALKT
ncbi:MAG: glycosyltransferase [Rhodocyclaceae bacterium]|nr:glycosyltransferase [Rhodocyclaceae bacterium]